MNLAMNKVHWFKNILTDIYMYYELLVNTFSECTQAATNAASVSVPCVKAMF